MFSLSFKYLEKYLRVFQESTFSLTIYSYNLLFIHYLFTFFKPTYKVNFILLTILYSIQIIFLIFYML